MEKPFAKARGFFIYFEIGCEPFEQGIPHATKTSGTFLDRQPAGREAANPTDGVSKVVHRTRIQSKSAF